MAEIYLRTAQFLFSAGHTESALNYLALALGECNKTQLGKVQRKHVLAALSYGRRI